MADSISYLLCPVLSAIGHLLFKLEQRLLLFHLGDLLFQLLDPSLQTLILQTQDIEPIEKLFTLDLCPFEGTFQSCQFKLSRSLVKWKCHRRS